MVPTEVPDEVCCFYVSVQHGYRCGHGGRAQGAVAGGASRLAASPMVLLRTPEGDFAFGYGMNELGGTNSPRADTHFRAASNTKTMTAAVIVLLVGRKIAIRRTGLEIC